MSSRIAYWRRIIFSNIMRTHWTKCSCVVAAAGTYQGSWGFSPALRRVDGNFPVTSSSHKRIKCLFNSLKFVAHLSFTFSCYYCLSISLMISTPFFFYFDFHTQVFLAAFILLVFTSHYFCTSFIWFHSLFLYLGIRAKTTRLDLVFTYLYFGYHPQVCLLITYFTLCHLCLSYFFLCLTFYALRCRD